MCAVAARHMSCTTEFDPLIADHYFQTCLDTLIPALQDPDLLKNPNYLIAVILLRVFEELDGLHNVDHLFGLQALLDAQDYPNAGHGLARAAFEVAMRQEIAMSFDQQRPVLGKLRGSNTTLSFSPASETTWALRSSIFFSEVLEFCYGNQDQSIKQWQDLVEYHHKWVEMRPLEFEPIYADHSEFAEFPTICYLDDVHGKKPFLHCRSACIRYQCFL